ncbi:hypothetical protein [Winogradskyella sp. SYSU M77433]|uniref:hypothetical protein n=1 Tax=Winogradskyella sp. SYSU M77433 TaxID=3042722 RepID=UPI002480000E|nr:hypothetical protein [Winogradskyella sp. SYSU M77433]MDH7913689.1 hypothetical protein [Winogradskyella sp. SYSU M77433]
MKLTESQIEDLYAFTRKHFVEHYDLQTELVDHLANDIETMWQDEPKLSFEDARDKAFKKFGIFGFMEAIEQKSKAMNKRYRSYLWKELKKWFEIPQILATIVLFLIFYVSFSSKIAGVLSAVFYGIIAVWTIYKNVRLNRQFVRRKKISNKKWMLEELIFKQAGVTSLIVLSQVHHTLVVSDEFSMNIYAIIGLSVVYTILLLLNYISFELIPNKAEDLLNETYPEFSL